MQRNEPLWKPVDQAQRLAELISDDPEQKLVPLRRDVRSLGVLLGRVLKEQEGDELFGNVERLRELLTKHRETAQSADSQLLRDARKLVNEVNTAHAHKITKAFATYFELTNLAETNHRKRRRRASRLNASRPPLPGSFRGTLQRMKKAGVDCHKALELFQQISITPVFTAHPTEVARRTVLFARGRIAHELERLDNLPLSEPYAEEREIAIAAEITSLWQTDEVRRFQPTVTDEIRMGLDYYKISLLDSVPRVYEEIADAFREVYGVPLATRDLSQVISFGSWIGGDRDGNPHVTPGCTADALRMARHLILDFYLAQMDTLYPRLSASVLQTTISAPLAEALDFYQRKYAEVPMDRVRYPEPEKYRRYLAYVHWRLHHSRFEPEGKDAYRTAEEFAADLKIIRDSMAANAAERLAERLLDPFPGGFADLFVVGADETGVFVPNQATIQHDHRNAGIHRLRDRIGQRLRFFRRDDQQINPLADKFLNMRTLLERVVLRVFENHVEIRMLRRRIFDVGIHLDTPGFAQIRLGHADGVALVLGKRGKGNENQSEQRDGDFHRCVGLRQEV